MATVSAYPTSYDSGYSAYSVSGLTNAETDSSSTTYATINLTRNTNAVTQIYYNFDFSSIPSGATIDSVTCTAKCYISTTNSGRVATRQVQLFTGTTAKGSAATVSNSTTAFSVTAGSWTRAELQNAKIRVYAVRGTSNVTTNYYFRFYGATMEVTYTEASTGNKVFIKSSGTWKQASKMYVKVSGAWKEVSKVFKKVNGAWVEQADKSAMFDTKAIYKKG